jgi:hypothetical protein
LGRPEPEFLQSSELEEIFWQRLAWFYEGIRTSDQNIMSKWTSEFSITSTDNTKDLSTLTSDDILFPLWAERKITTTTNSVWEFLPTVNLDTLADARKHAQPAVAFSGTATDVITATFSYYGGEVGAPLYTFRIRYQPKSSYSADIDTAHMLPDNLTPLLVADVKAAVVPQMIANALKHKPDSPDEIDARIQGWTMVKAQAETDVMRWMPAYEQFIRRSRTGIRGRNRRDTLTDMGYPRMRLYW